MMASHHIQIRQDQENREKTKMINGPTAVARRLALEDLGNRIHLIDKTNRQPKPPLKQPQQQQKKQQQLQKQQSQPLPTEKLIKTVVNKQSSVDAAPTTKDEAPAAEENIATMLTAIDMENNDEDPQMVAEYAADIFKYLRELECKYEVKEKYLSLHKDHQTTPKMRTILLNWLTQVHKGFNMVLDTFHLTVSIIDRYLQINPKIGRDNLQLVGISAFLIASKYEEVFIPDLGDYVFVCDDAFDRRELLQMEMDILKKLDCSLNMPLPIHFLRRYSRIAEVSFAVYNLSKFILDLALVNYDTCHYRPSLLAAAACCLSMAIVKNDHGVSKLWTPRLIRHSNYKYSDIKSIIYKCAHVLLIAKDGNYESIIEKYAESRFEKVSENSKIRGPLVKMLADKCSST